LLKHHFAFCFCFLLKHDLLKHNFLKLYIGLATALLKLFC
jgi:hypothetical protein